MTTHSIESVNVATSINFVSGNQYNNHYYVPTTTSLNDAPLGLLSLYFTGREWELVHIRETLDVIHGDIPTRCVVYGMHGIGKTQLALQFARLSFEQQRYSHIFWFSATTVEKLQDGFTKLLHLVHHPDRSHLEQGARLTAARRWLEDSGFVNWLIVLDNVDPSTLSFLREHLPRRNRQGNILFTTRTSSVAQALAYTAGQQHEPLDLRLPSVEDAIMLLFAESRTDAIGVTTVTLSKAREVVNYVGRLPLAVSHTASFMKETQETLDDILLLLHSEHRTQVCFDARSACSSNVYVLRQIMSWENQMATYEEKSVTATFMTQLDDLERQSPDASNLLKILSFFDPESITLTMITQGAEALSRSLAPSTATSSDRVATPSDGFVFGKFIFLLRRTKPKRPELMDTVDHPQLQLKSLLHLILSPVHLQDAIMQLQNRSLINHIRIADTSVLRIHDLVISMVQESMRNRDAEREWFEIAVELACGAFQVVEDPTSYKCWSQCAMFAPHFYQLTKRATYGNQSVPVMKANVKIAAFLWSSGQYGEAERLYGQTLGFSERQFGMEHQETLIIVHNLAAVYESQGRYNEAETQYNHVLELRKMQLGSDHPDTLLTMHGLATVYEFQGRHGEAEMQFKHILTLREKKLGLYHQDTLRTMHGLAHVYESQGQHSTAETLYKRVLVLREEYLGLEHADTLSTIHSLAAVYESQESKVLYERVLAFREHHLGSEHPDTLSTMHSLAALYESQGQHSEAEALYKHVVTFREKHLGLEHPDTLNTMHKLVLLHGFLGHYSEAKALRDKVLVIKERKRRQAMERLDPTHSIDS
jgi:tetratricopeptide (TPR) repeat protein